jgi:AcrR family transcriptional regulator
MPPTRLTQHERKAKTREAILTAATRLVAQRGLEGTSLDDIAGSIGLTKGAIYANFANKGALVDALVERYAVPVDLAPLFRTDLSLVDRLGLVGRGVAELSRTVSRETAMLDLEYRLFGLRNPRRREAEQLRYQAERKDFFRRFEAVNDAQAESLTLGTKELLTTLGVLVRTVLLAGVEEPDGLSAEGIERLFRLLAESAGPKRRKRSGPKAG